MIIILPHPPHLPHPNAQSPIPNPQIRAILSLPAKIVAIVTELIWRSEN
ncbi:hypothetical protein [Nostoc sp. ChiQUE01b]|nr:hypothetical protein [Nostoc sp. ChiQUE01b]MDZ8256829.1 hypothetical protein [Nostoc sp. ChiQUE01b]